VSLMLRAMYARPYELGFNDGYQLLDSPDRRKGNVARHIIVTHLKPCFLS